jgi:hypothetical protein
MARNAIKTPFDTVTSHLGLLSQVELEELGEMVAALLAVTAPEAQEDEQVDGNREKSTRPAARGHIEEKVINGCGPYLYLRYWQGKTLKSKYIGKKGNS